MVPTPEEPIILAPTTIRANKTLHYFSIPSVTNMATGANIDVGDVR